MNTIDTKANEKKPVVRLKAEFTDIKALLEYLFVPKRKDRNEYE